MSSDGPYEGGIERVMVDIETLGLAPGDAILSVGAVRFGTGGLGDEFYREISLESCQDAGLELDAGTLEWWLDQDDAVTGVLVGGDSLDDVLEDFATFYGAAEEIWAFSPSFDCDILAAAYDAVGLVEPWSYREERCCRTMASLPIWPDLDQSGDEHDALDDARYQARQTAEALRSLHTGKEREEVEDSGGLDR